MDDWDLSVTEEVGMSRRSPALFRRTTKRKIHLEMSQSKIQRIDLERPGPYSFKKSVRWPRSRLVDDVLQVDDDDEDSDDQNPLSGIDKHSSDASEILVASPNLVTSSAASPPSALYAYALTCHPSVTLQKPVTSGRSSIAQPVLTRVDPDKVPDICLSDLWKQCKLGKHCPDMHYPLPYRWQIHKGNWEDFSDMEEIEKNYCDPQEDRVSQIDFVTMTSGVHRIRRLSTVSSVFKQPDYFLTTEWIWFWKDEEGAWIEYGNPNVNGVSSNISSQNLENIYVFNPKAIIPFKAGHHNYEINFREMKQKNIVYKTQRDMRRRPKYLKSKDVISPKSTIYSGVLSPQNLRSSPLRTQIYPRTWDAAAMPEIGCAKVLVSDTSKEFLEIVSIFTKTLTGQEVKKMWRLQNPFLWHVFYLQREMMKSVNDRRDTKEMRLFHGTAVKNVNAICHDNFDWRVCGTHRTSYGHGSYFARDASYSHNYSTPTPGGTRMMFVARVLVGDYVVGNSQTKRPPPRPGSSTRYYDSCVDNVSDPSIYVVFEKHQIYPEYLLEYGEVLKY